MKSIFVFLFFLSGYLFAGEQLDFFQADKKNSWDIYLEGTAFSLSGENTKAILKWKEASEKGNLHAIARLYQDDLMNDKKEFSSLYEKAVNSKFGIIQYLKIRYGENGGSEKAETQKKEIINSMLELENTDDYWALSIIGNYFTDRLLNRQEFNKGVSFLVKAAEGGYSPAQDKLGTLYWQGNEFFNKDLNKAKLWLGKAATIKDKYACLHLAQIYHKGTDDVKPDIPKSIPYYEEAARQGVNDAHLNLALIYEEGQAIAKDPEKTHLYLSKLLECGDPEIYKFLGARYFYSREEWKDKQKGLLWYEKAAEFGTIVDQYKYADLYFTDPDVRNYQKALQITLKIAPKDGKVSHQFHILVYLRLGNMYMNGLGVKQDYLEAKKYYEKVDTTSEAIEAIIAMYLNGWGVKQSDEMVIFYINKLMDPARGKGYDPGPYFEILANIYKKRGDSAKQIENLRLASLCGNSKALVSLKEVYEPMDAEKIGDFGDIHFALMKYEEADKFYLIEGAKNNLRNRYEHIRLMGIEKCKNYDGPKSLEEMKKLAGADFSSYVEKMDHVILDRIIDPELVNIPLKARPHFWLGIQYKKRSDATNENRAKLQEEAIFHFLESEKAGCWFSGLNAAVLFLRGNKSEEWAKGREILERLYKDKNPFASGLLGALHTIPKYGNVDANKSKEYFDTAYGWDTQKQWSGMSVDTLIKKGIYQLLITPIQIKEKEPEPEKSNELPKTK